MASAFDAAKGDLKLTYAHKGLARVRISGGGRPPLTLLLRRRRDRPDLLATRRRAGARSRPGAQRP
ncbi:hypothetical protein ACRAWD_18850 [Caulobacter segnis]